MQSSHWVALLKKLPAESHNQLSIVTSSGTEVLMQAIQLLEGECLVFKGRLAASQDTGRLFFVPYDQIAYIGFMRSVSEEEIRLWYGEGATVTAETAVEKPVEANGSSRSMAPSRAALLERVRSRTTSAGFGPIAPPSSS